jgi:hypothetical protein
MPRKLTVKKSRSVALTISRSAIRAQKLVYIAKADKKLNYNLGRSHIAYIGTTKKGANRIASSAANKAEELLTQHGIKHLHFFVVRSAKRRNVESWKKLERALILTFRSMFGEPPMGNSQGKKSKWKDEKEYFTTSTLENIINYYSE